MNDAYCSMIHGGLWLDLASTSATAGHCCLRNTNFKIDHTKDFWNYRQFEFLRMFNQQDKWSYGCNGCKRLEQSGLASFRTGMNSGLEIYNQYNLPGPLRIDFKFDLSCNLACRTCGPHSSTFWQKHLKDHSDWQQPINSAASAEFAISVLEKLDLSNLRQFIFCGGETLLGQKYWQIVEWLVEHVPHAKEKLIVGFQTNGTQPIADRNLALIEKLHLVKLNISLDGVGNKFEYLRWPALWSQVTTNILDIKEHVGSNVMFVIEETLSIFNLLYSSELDHWVNNNFTTNRDGDVVNHTKHLAYGKYSLNNCTQEYVDAVSETKYSHLIPSNWAEAPEKITEMIAEIKKFDQFRSQTFESTFPEVAEFYRRYL